MAEHNAEDMKKLAEILSKMDDLLNDAKRLLIKDVPVSSNTISKNLGFNDEYYIDQF